MEKSNIENVLRELILNLEADGADDKFTTKVKSISDELKADENRENVLRDLRYMARALDIVQLKNNSLILANKAIELAVHEINRK